MNRVISQDAANEGKATEVAEQMLFPSEQLSLTVTLDVGFGGFRFEWSHSQNVIARGALVPLEQGIWFLLSFTLEMADHVEHDHCNGWPASSRALLKRIQRRLPVGGDGVRIGLLSDRTIGIAEPGRWLPLALEPGIDAWKWLAREVQQFSSLLQSRLVPDGTAADRGRLALYLLACALLRVAPERSAHPGSGQLELRVTFNQLRGCTEFAWTDPTTHAVVANGVVRAGGGKSLQWELSTDAGREPAVTTSHRAAIRSALDSWLKRFPTNRNTFAGYWIDRLSADGRPLLEPEAPFGPNESPYDWIEDNIVGMAEALSQDLPPPDAFLSDAGVPIYADYERYERRLRRKEQRHAEEQLRRRAILARKAEERRAREEREAAQRAAANKNKTSSVLARPAKERLPLPSIPVRLEMPALGFQETAFPIPDLSGYALRERAALWWVSNQSDDLLSLPFCRIQRLEYQVRAALRVLGALRGRALLSDEVGLGKTIEAGLVIKELLTRGMVKRFLVLTVPSLVDQWEEELNEKFGLATATTNHSQLHGQPRQFWEQNNGIVASLHTLKQPAHLEVARQVHWDILVVDEAHYLRNRDSQAWQAVNSLSRQFLLLLTATPVQNSLDELYNLVTLLKPGQLPSPKEFRARFLDPKRPRQPREPEELRRLLGQVMIRNTRANAGVELPPRRAETVSFVPQPEEATQWQKWEAEFRESLQKLRPHEASLWGRLLLQTAGSSPAAWRSALKKFPHRERARAWQETTVLENSWQQKCQLLTPIIRAEGGAVIFSQFLETQGAIAEFLRAAKVPTFVISGSTPATDRQPITEEFRRHHGALLLTHSGTEGRNLQFCHRLVNFDLPWNPMEIEQRIGRLHRLGQQHPVRIFNFVQAGTLQEHLLQLLQEKLNLFELVVGETGLVLGEAFSSDEFAEEILRRWRESEGNVGEAFASLGEELAAARDSYNEVKKLDETLFAKDYESL